LLLLASLDVQRRWLARSGRTLFGEAAAAARSLKEEINTIDGMRVFGVEGDARLAGHLVDPLRLVVNVTETGWDGYEVERFLRTEFNVEDEMADQFNVVYILSPHDDKAATRRLVEGLHAVSKSAKPTEGTSRRPGDVDSHLLQPPIPPLAIAPREAALAKQTMVRREDAAGRTCAEMVMFYPPGIPLLMPGEVVTRETLEVCQKLLAAGANPYASDPTFETICVVK
jgi:arginine/lysine/ornithine decarboxylase